MAAGFPFKLITPSRMVFEGLVASVVLKTPEGEICLLKGHEDYVAPIVVGALKFDTAEGEKRLGCAAYGFVNLMDGSATVFTTTFEFVEEIDVPRAKENMERTRIIIAEGAIGDELIDAKARYDRCKARLAVAQLGRGK